MNRKLRRQYPGPETALAFTGASTMRHGFSLLALLFVFGCNPHGDQAARETARREARWLREAILEYRAYYGTDLKFVLTNSHQPSSRIVPVLMASPESPDLEASNPKRIAFLPGNTRRPRFLDPWGSEYEIAIAEGETNIVTIGSRTIVLGTRGYGIAVWSRGPNRINEWGKGDDPNSWDDH